VSQSKRPQPGAAESNAGDDFHLLWAARRALHLLDPQGKLRGIRVEGPAPQEAAELDPDGDQLLGIDLTEYFGGACFEDASGVVHSQLKYSTRRPDIAWTASRLAQGRTAKYSGSVIHRLAQVFKTCLDGYGREAVLEKLRIDLVSNRPCSRVLAHTMADVKEALRDHPQAMRSADLRSRLATNAAREYDRLMRGSLILGSRQFTDFLRILDLSHCGEPSRLDQEMALVREIGRLGFGEVSDQYSRLKEFVRSGMMPEGQHRGVLMADNIAPVFGIPSVSHLFPAPSRFEELELPVDREQGPDIARSIINAEGVPVCLHGGAGVGKTVLARSLNRDLPEDSAVVLFDCYGGGSYLDRSEVRHGYPRAIMQMANELATKTGSPLLLHRDQRPEELLRAFRQRLECASSFVRGRCTEALVVIVVDAADNSVAAAATCEEESFLRGLLTCRLPDGCRLVVTARSHRQADLSLPSGTVSVPILPFSLEETRANLRRHLPQASEQEADELHRLSNGIPRIQGYVLSQLDSQLDAGLDCALDQLRPAGKTLEGLIDEQLLEAGRRMGEEDFAERICPALLTLPRPIPLEYVALLTGENEQAVSDFCVDMYPGLHVEDNVVSFRDEDIESHLRDRFGGDDSMSGALADCLAERSASESYAAIHLAEVLRRAGRHQDIVRLVHRERQPAAIADLIERKEVFATRARLALEAVLRSNDRVELLKLLFVVAEAAKTDEAVAKLLLENADLACRYGDPATVQRLYLNDRNGRVEWYGPTHLQCAANYARNRDTHGRAMEHLRSAEAWLRHWSSLPEDERQRWTIDVESIALGAEAVLRLCGSREASTWLSGWRPKSVVFAATTRLVRNLVMTEGSDAFELLGETRLRADAILAIADAAIGDGLLPPRELILRGVSVWSRLASAGVECERGMVRPGILLCEAAAAHQVDTSTLRALIEFFAPAAPEHRGLIYSDESGEAYDALLRASALLSVVEGRELKADAPALLPPRLREEPQEEDDSAKRHWEEERKSFRELYEFLLPAYVLRARLMARKLEPSSVPNELQSAMDRGMRIVSARMRHDEQYLTGLKAGILADAVVHAASVCQEAFRSVCTRYSREGWLGLSLSLARKASGLPALHDEAIRLLDDVQKYLDNNALPGSEKVDTFVTCSRIAGVVDAELGRRYFDLAVEAASEIDEEAFGMLRLVSGLASRAATDKPQVNEGQLAADFSAIVEDCHWRLRDWDHFPWDECVRGIASLSPAVAAAALARWDQRGILGFCQESPALVNTCLEKGAVSPAAAISWGVLSPLGSMAAMEVSLRGLEALKSRGLPAGTYVADALSLLVDHAVRLAPMRDRKHLSEQVTRWAKAHNMAGHVALRDAATLAAFLRALDESDVANVREVTPPSRPRAIADREEPKSPTVNWEELLEGRSFCNPAEIENALRELHALEDETSRRWPGGSQLSRQFLSRVEAKARPSEYAAQLDALLSVDSELLGFEELADTLRSCLAGWSHHPLVREWRERLPELLATQWFHAFFYEGLVSLYRVEHLEKDLGVPRPRMLDCLANALPRHLREVSALSVYAVALGLVDSLPAGAALNVLAWAVPMLRTRIDGEGLASHGIDVGALPDPGVELEAAILWYLFGHPDKRVRWRGVHAARRMVRLGEGRILISLARWLDTGRGHPFVMPGTTFYWLAARQWFFLLVDRLSAEMPAAVLPIADLVAREAVRPAIPHALIVRIANRAALRLAEHAQSPYSAQEIVEIRESLTPIGQVSKNASRERLLRDDYRSTSAVRFQFDRTDTLPYWYSPAGGVFGVIGKAFCIAAEKWICDEWGYAEPVRDSDPVCKWQGSDRDWALRSNRHGSEPTIEDLRIYLEYNAMFCVAGELLATKPVVEDDWESDPWGYWLNRWDLSWRDQWLADRRQTTPLERSFWVSSQDKVVEWTKGATEDDRRRVVGLLDPLHAGYIVVEARQSRHDYGGNDSTYVASALVAAETGQALLHALAQCQTPHDYAIPLEGGDHQFDVKLGDGTRFALTGWIEVEGGDTEGLDEHDPLRYSLGRTLAVPGSKLTQWADLALDDGCWESHRRERPDVPLTIFEHWNDCLREEYVSGFQTEGHRLWVRISDLLEFLRSGEWALIVECEIARHADRRERRRLEDEYVSKAELYLIHSDGTVETTTGCSRLGETPG